MVGREKRMLMLVILSCLLVFMGVGFAVLRTTLNIGGTSTALNTWDVRIINITAIENETGAKNIAAEVDGVLGTSATFSTNFHAPGDYIEYNVEVKNGGSLDATLYSLVVTPSGDDIDLFEFFHNAEQGAVLKAGETVTFNIKVSYKLDSTRLPRGETKFELSVNYGQGEGVPEIPGDGTESDKNWDFEVDESGTITAYNYDLGTDVVVPATNYEGKAITSISAQSFTSKYNTVFYYDEISGNFYSMIYETEAVFLQVKDKLVAFFLLECQGDSTCEEYYKTRIYVCKDSNTCYNILNMEKNTVDPTVELTTTALPTTALTQGQLYINPDPNVPFEESIEDAMAKLTSLDLSNATNLTTIQEHAFYSSQINNELIIPDSVTEIGEYAFAYNQITGLTYNKYRKRCI